MTSNSDRTWHGCGKFNPTIETVEMHYELEKTRLEKKRGIKMVQYGNYTKMFYGSEAEKEKIKREHRQALLEQVKDKETAQKKEFTNKVFESQVAADLVKPSIEKDAKQHGEKSQYFKQFRDQNKILMESRAEEQRKKREEEHRKEQELLKYNPINWSKTLS